VAASLERIRFLLVDDHVHVHNLMKTILRGFGAEWVFEAKSTAEAFDLLRRQQIDILFLDYLMGDEDGVEFCRRLRTAPDSPAPFLPVIMLTAHSDRTRVQAARDAGATEFCIKPVTPADVIRKVAAVIDRPRPFVRSPKFVGPDRRRNGGEPPGPERRGWAVDAG
jgi:CheY-like chemotaxis protein